VNILGRGAEGPQDTIRGMRRITVLAALAALVVACRPTPAADAGQADTALLFSFFRGNGEAGLYLAWSDDGLHWEEVRPGHVWLAPAVGESKLMRDPHIVRGPDGVFHMVWTVGWWERGIGHASSTDLVNWSAQQFIPVMAHEPAARNAWAPEAFYDPAADRYVVFWATSIPGRFPETDDRGDGGLNHRIYSTVTQDFRTFEETRLFYDPGFSVIDSTIVRDRGRYVMFLKNETLTPPEKNIRMATAQDVTGPWSPASPSLTGDEWVEGPSAVFWRGYWYVYFDKYRDRHYGAIRSADMETWEDVSEQVVMPDGIRHGTAFEVPRTVLERLRQASASDAP
jgi:hypothetical protein